MGVSNVPLAVRLWSSPPTVGASGAHPVDRHITAGLRDLTFRSSVPGGFQSASFSLDRPVAGADAALEAYNGVVVYDTRTAAVVWEGTLEDPGRGVGSDGETWHLSAAGSAAHAGDESRPLIYIDRRLDEWQSIRSDVSGWTAQSELRAADDEPSLNFVWPRGTPLPAGPVSVSLQYRGILDAAQHVALIGGTFDCGRTDASGDRLFEVVARMGGGSWAAVDTHTWTATETPFLASVSGAWSGNRDQLRLGSKWTAAAVGAVTSDVEWVRVLHLYVRGTNYLQDGSESAGPYGNPFVRADLVVGDLLGRMLPRYDGVNAQIAANVYEINHLVYPDGASATQVLDDMMLFHPNYFWAAWDTNPQTGGYRFEWKPWPETIGYEADIVDGFDASSGNLELYNKVLVRYKDFMGRTKTVTRTQSVPELTRRGVTRSAPPVDVGDEVASVENAVQIGDMFLGEHRTPPNAGTLTVARPIKDLDAGRLVQPWEIRPGKLIRVRGVSPRVDALNATARDAITVFKVTGVEYNASSNTASLELDSQPRTVAQLLARMENRRYRKR